LNSGPWWADHLKPLDPLLQTFFALVIFQMGLLLLLPAGLRLRSFYLCLLCSEHHRCEPPGPAQWLRWGLTNCFTRLALNLHPPELCLLSSWDYRCEPLCSVLVSRIFNQNLEKHQRCQIAFCGQLCPLGHLLNLSVLDRYSYHSCCSEV
jgi:hypothetical protein